MSEKNRNPWPTLLRFGSLALLIVFYLLINGRPWGVAALEDLTGGETLLDLSLTFSAEQAAESIKALGEEGRRFAMTRIAPLDIVFPAFFLMSGFLWITFFLHELKEERRRWIQLRWLPVLAVLFDYLENVSLFLLMRLHPDFLPFLATLSGRFFTPVKFLFYGATIAAVVLLVTRLSVERRQRISLGKDG